MLVWFGFNQFRQSKAQKLDILLFFLFYWFKISINKYVMPGYLEKYIAGEDRTRDAFRASLHLSGRYAIHSATATFTF